MNKPKAKLVGANANIFNLLAIANSSLEKAGMKDKGKEMFDRAIKTDSYDKAIGIILEYVDPIESDTLEDGGFHGSEFKSENDVEG